MCWLSFAGCGDDASVDSSTGASGSGGGTGQGGSNTTGGAGGSGNTGATNSGAMGTGGGLPACAPMPACDLAPPAPGPALGFDHFSSDIAAGSGSDNHRGRDLFLNPGDPQWVLGKFSYGILDDDIKDEQVDIYLSRDCQAWELLGSARTTEDGAHATVEGVADTGGRVYFQVPPNLEVGLGRHRIHMVVRGDLTTADAFIDVVPPATPVIMSDIDGTLTTEETEEFTALLSGTLPNANVDSAEVLRRLAGKGYRPFYMTARPEFLGKRTRAFLEMHGYPPGTVHTTLNKSGALGGTAVDYKSGELAWLFGKGLLPAWAFGNTDTDAEAYENGGIQPLEHRIFFQFDDAIFGGRRIEAYTELLAEVDALPAVCQP